MAPKDKNHMRKLHSAITAFIMVAAYTTTQAQTNDLPRTLPERCGISSYEMIRLTDSLMALPKTSLHSVMVLRHDSVVGEAYPAPWNKESMHTMYSCSKTFVAAAVGIAIGEGKLRLDSRVADFFPKTFNRSKNYRRMTVRDLLTMTSGIEPDWVMRNEGTTWCETWLGKPVARPGKVFKYDSMCTYMLSAIMQKATGMPLLDYLKERVFNPMHITEVEWEVSPESINTGGWGLRIQTESLAKFGLLLLHDGAWHGKQLIPAQWARAMKEKQVDNGGFGYGFQMWQCEYPGASRADGAYGQYILIIPNKDMVAVITECTAIDGINQRRLFWRQLLPTIVDKPMSATISPELYRKRMEGYELNPARGKAIGTLLSTPLRIALDKNPIGWTEISARRTARQGEILFSYVQDDDTVALNLYNNVWTSMSTPVHPVYSIGAQGRFSGLSRPFNVAGCYAVTSDGSLTVALQYPGWVTSLKLKMPLNNDGSDIKVSMNHEKAIDVKGVRI